MSKCKECGSELADGAKFCCECGCKVQEPAKAEPSLQKCPKCGCEFTKGTKFCSECGCKMQEQVKTKRAEEADGIDWDSPFTLADGTLPLTDEQVESVAYSLNRLALSANPDRVVMPDGNVFKGKIREFRKVYSQRLGDAPCKEAML